MTKKAAPEKVDVPGYSAEERLTALQEEFDAFKRRVVTVAHRVGEEQGWCSVQETLNELGLQGVRPDEHIYTITMSTFWKPDENTSVDPDDLNSVLDDFQEKWTDGETGDWDELTDVTVVRHQVQQGGEWVDTPLSHSPIRAETK